ncbi:MAG: divalent-cation tolerance protein CutA [Euryarchaeota archaeon]|nr:divalent-cation tolerance protein CutA [Euryarchaeota archaeon]
MGSNSNTLRQADGFVLLITTTSSRREADLIADGLVGGGLAACVNVVQVDSTYKWKGQVERAGEFMLFCKTRADLTDRAAEKIRGIHSYEVPEIIVIPIQKGSAPYLEWLGETLAKTKLA